MTWKHQYKRKYLRGDGLRYKKEILELNIAISKFELISQQKGVNTIVIKRLYATSLKTWHQTRSEAFKSRHSRGTINSNLDLVLHAT